MAKKRKVETAELYDHKAATNRASASIIEVHNRVVKAKRREISYIPEVASTPDIDEQDAHASFDNPISSEGETQEIAEEDIGVIVKATTRAKRYVNTVGAHMLSVAAPADKQ